MVQVIKPEAISAAELKVVQAAFAELQIAQAKLQGVLVAGNLTVLKDR